MPFLIFGIIKKKWTCIVIGLIPIILFLLVASSVAYRILMASSGCWVYKQAFGQPPTSNVEILEKKYEFSTDSETVHLKFKADKKNLYALLDNRFKEVSLSEFENRVMGDHPDWFNPLDSSPDIFYQSLSYDKNFMVSEALLSYNKKTSIAYFYSINID